MNFECRSRAIISEDARQLRQKLADSAVAQDPNAAQQCLGEALRGSMRLCIPIAHNRNSPAQSQSPTPDTAQHTTRLREI